jgi:hypothetical protein
MVAHVAQGPRAAVEIEMPREGPVTEWGVHANVNDTVDDGNAVLDDSSDFGTHLAGA